VIHPTPLTRDEIEEEEAMPFDEKVYIHIYRISHDL
jgi:hypothetical protein